MSVFVFAMEDDFEVQPGVSFREATPLQAVRQDLLHILMEAEAVGDSLTGELEDSVRSMIVDALGEHPFVASIDGIEATPDGENNTWTVSVFINGSQDPVTATTSGG